MMTRQQTPMYKQNRARDTLRIVQAAIPVGYDEMFPDYKDGKELCGIMIESLKKWPEREFVQAALDLFKEGHVRGGMATARERIHFYVREECNWSYLV